MEASPNISIFHKLGRSYLFRFFGSKKITWFVVLTSASGRNRKFECLRPGAAALDGGHGIERKNMMSNMASFPGDLRRAVFKIRAHIQVWRSDNHPAGGQA